MTAALRDTIHADLPALAIAINSEHALAEQYASMAIHRAKRAGELLNQAKAKVNHGEWLPWLSANCPTIAARTAQAYMKLDREWGTLESKCATVAHLTVSDALKLLADPKPEPSWRDGLPQDTVNRLENAAERINARSALLGESIEGLGDLLRTIRDRNGATALGFPTFSAYCESLFLDGPTRDMLLDPARRWHPRDWDDEQENLIFRWILKQQGYSDHDARAILATEGAAP